MNENFWSHPNWTHENYQIYASMPIKMSKDKKNKRQKSIIFGFFVLTCQQNSQAQNFYQLIDHRQRQSAANPIACARPTMWTHLVICSQLESMIPYQYCPTWFGDFVVLAHHTHAKHLTANQSRPGDFNSGQFNFFSFWLFFLPFLFVNIFSSSVFFSSVYSSFFSSLFSNVSKSVQSDDSADFYAHLPWLLHCYFLITVWWRTEKMRGEWMNWGGGGENV